MNYNEKLYELYNQYWKSLQNAVNSVPLEERPTHPLLISLPDESAYHKAEVKLMVIGQETNDWESIFGKHSIESLLNFYSTFLNENNKAKKSFFWQYIRKGIKQIEATIPNGTVSLVWNNIHKLGRVGTKGAPNKITQEITEREFNVIEEELKILEPDIVLFLTGPHYDNVINTYLRGIKLVEVSEGKRNQIVHCGHPALPEFSYRTYHPGYLNRLSPEKSAFNRETPINVILKALAEKVR